MKENYNFNKLTIYDFHYPKCKVKNNNKSNSHNIN